MGEVAVRQCVAVPPPSTTNLALVDAVQLRVSSTLRPACVGLLQRRYVRTREHPVDPVELGVVRHLLRRVLALDEM